MTIMRYRYFDYCLESNLAISELDEIEQESKPDLSFSVINRTAEAFAPCDWYHQWFSKSGKPFLSLAKIDDFYIIEFRDIARFEINYPLLEISCQTVTGVNDATIRHLLLDQVLPRCFYHLFNQIVLHASFISIAGRGAAFLGRSGHGKSTLAASFQGKDITFLTDDCILLKKIDGRIYGIPSYNSIRLYDDSIAAVIGQTNTQYEQVSHYNKKKRIFSSSPEGKLTPLVAAFFLTDPSEDLGKGALQITPLSTFEALPKLLSNRFPLAYGNKELRRQQLDQLADLITTSISFYTLSYPRRYDMLPQIHQEVHQILSLPIST